MLVVTPPLVCHLAAITPRLSFCPVAEGHPLISQDIKDVRGKRRGVEIETGFGKQNAGERTAVFWLV